MVALEMLKQSLEKELYRIIEDIEPYAADDTGLYIPPAEVEKTVALIMQVLDRYNIP